MRTITANTAHTITVGAPWSPALGSSFTFSVPASNTVPRLDAFGAPAAGGAAMKYFPFPPATGNQKSSLHFLAGGGGGGGTGSHACLALLLNSPTANISWTAGSGGGGGGGVVALRAGDLLSLGATARVLANGGSTADLLGSTSASSPSPGGGGAGGSVVLQSGRLIDVSGLVDVRGGAGGLLSRKGTGNPNVSPYTSDIQIQGGAGAPGFVRLEVPGNPTTALLANMQPPPISQNVAPLQERDDLVVMRSHWYSTNLLFGPEYQRYEIQATVNGQSILYSDDPAVSNIPAGVGAALRVQFQAATIDLQTGEATDIRQWRDGVRSGGNQVGIASDGHNDSPAGARSGRGTLIRASAGVRPRTPGRAEVHFRAVVPRGRRRRTAHGVGAIGVCDRWAPAAGGGMEVVPDAASSPAPWGRGRLARP
jgi:hypothetical protein